MVTAQPTTKLTYADYCLTPDDERYELLDGELLMAPAPIESHQIAVMELGTLLHTFVKARGLGQVFSAPYDVVLSETDVVQPDLLFVSNERAHIRTPRQHPRRSGPGGRDIVPLDSESRLEGTSSICTQSTA